MKENKPDLTVDGFHFTIYAMHSFNEIIKSISNIWLFMALQSNYESINNCVSDDVENLIKKLNNV